MYVPKKEGFGTAIVCHSAYKILNPSVRYILARNVHAMLGVKVIDPVNLVIAYSPDGAEVTNSELDFKITGDVAFYLKVCELSNIPIYNTKNDDCVTRLVTFITNLQKLAEAKLKEI